MLGKYTPPATPIDVIAERAVHTLKISVADRGLGIPVGEEEKLLINFTGCIGKVLKAGWV